MPHARPTKVEAITTPPWQVALRDAIRDVGELLEFLDLEAGDVECFQPRVGEFPLLVPRSFAARMIKGDPGDPLLRQILPSAQEQNRAPGFSADPLAEFDLARQGVLRKYRGRALLIATATCPVHCRYCFRRHFPYEIQTASRQQWTGAVEHLRKANDIREVILSGGDPLSLSTRRLATLLSELSELDSVGVVRLHTRFPVILPERVDQDLLELIATTRLKTVVVVHCNHPNEIDGDVMAAMRAFRAAGSVVLNQSVLLHGINDDASVLVALSERLFECGVLPYYLHLLDPVAGAAHYQVGQNRGRALIAAVRERLPGYLVPRLVREVPGELSKTPIA